MCPDTSAFTRFITHTAEQIFQEYIVCAVKSIRAVVVWVGVFLHWFKMHMIFMREKNWFSLNAQEITAKPTDFWSTAVSPLIPWKYITAARSTFQTFIIEQCMMNSTRVFHFWPAWKQCQDLQWATAFVHRAHTLNTWINLQSVLEKKCGFIKHRGHPAKKKVVCAVFL